MKNWTALNFMFDINPKTFQGVMTVVKRNEFDTSEEAIEYCKEQLIANSTKPENITVKEENGKYRIYNKLGAPMQSFWCCEQKGE